MLVVCMARCRDDRCTAAIKRDDLDRPTSSIQSSAPPATGVAETGMRRRNSKNNSPGCMQSQCLYAGWQLFLFRLVVGRRGVGK